MDLLGLIIYVLPWIVVVWPPLLIKHDMSRYKRVLGGDKMRTRPKLWDIIPWIYTTAWSFMYLFLATAWMLYLMTVPEITTQLTPIFESTFLIMFFNITLNHLWGVVFFGYTDNVVARVLSFIGSILLFLTALTCTTLIWYMAYHLPAGAAPHAYTYFHIAAGVYLAYSLGLLFSTFVSGNWAFVKLGKLKVDAPTVLSS